MRVLVTGATGFVGTALVADLAARGIDVAAATRANPGEIDGNTDWSGVLRGVDVVFHLAGRAHVSHDPTDTTYQRVNVDGTRRLAEACAAASVRRLVFLSSVKVNGEESGTSPYTVDSVPRPLDVYGRSKLDAEKALADVSARTGLAFTIVRTPLVYGPGVKANFLRLMSAVDRGIPLPFGRIRNRRSLTYVKNLTDALVHVACQDPAVGRTYLVSDGDDVSTAELVRRIAVSLGRSPRLLPVPTSLLHIAGVLTARGAAVRRLTGSLTVDTSALRRETGWMPPYTMAEGLRETAAWYRVRGARGQG
jgi:nucleoside-diphosphate-sugar epimerase